VEQDLTLYVREGCHLCEEMLELLDAAEVEAHVVDIEGDAGLEAWYGERVPVLVRADEVIAQAPFDHDEVLEHLSRLRRGR
jgi:glutaredoxin